MAVRNIIVTMTYQLVSIAYGFIIPRLFLTTYGPNIHGLTSTITNIMSYVMLLYAGLNAVSIQSLYDPISKNDYNRLNEILNAIKMYYRNTGIAFILVITLLAFILPNFVGGIPSITVFLLMLVMGLQSALTSFLISSNIVLLQADQKLYVVNLINIVIIILRTLIQAVLITLNYSIIIVQLIPSLLLIITAIVQKRYIRLNYINLDEKIKADSSSLSNRWSALIHQISGLVVNNTDIILLTIVTRNMILISIYSVYQLVFTQLYTLMTSVFSQGVLAGFGNLMASGNTKELEDNYNIFEFIYLIFVSIVYSITAVLLPPFIKLYTSGTSGVEYLDARLIILFMIIGISNNIRVPGVTLINAGGYFKETQFRAIIEAMINLVTSIILVHYIGMYGLLIGTICSFVYRTTDIVIFSNKYILKKSSKLTVSRSLRMIIIIIFVSFICVNFSSFKIVDWFDWIIASFYVGIFAFCTTIIFNYTTEKTMSVKAYKIIYSLLQKKIS